MKYKIFLYEKNKDISSDSLISLSAWECRQAFGLDESTSLCIKRTSLGKPYFEGNPLFVSLSHTEGTAAVVIADFPVGIDIEKAGRSLPSRDTIKKLEKKYFSPAENEIVSRGDMSFLEMWVRKEAAVKLTGDGISGMKRTDTAGGDIVCRSIRLDGFVCFLAAHCDITAAESEISL